MCSLCGMLGGRGHWTETAANPDTFQDRAQSHTWHRERQDRTRLVNRVLKHYGMTLSDWASSFVLRSHTGQTSLVNNLTEVWAAAESLGQRECDPLDEDLLAALSRGCSHRRDVAVMDYASLIPVNVVTGFLGSGKTTLLQGLLASPQLRDTAVLVNEFGEIGLDHHLLESATESTLLLENGCLCCALRGDLQESLRDLFSRRERGEVPRFQRVVIETSGLADPVPIAYTVLTEPVIQHHFRLGNIVTTIDAVNGRTQLGQNPESVKQAAVADRLILTKTDLASAGQVNALRTELRRLNAGAPVIDSGVGDLDPERLLTDDTYDQESRAREVDRWLEDDGMLGSSGWGNLGSPGPVQSSHRPHHHDADIHSFCVQYEMPLDWTAFGVWMTMLLNRHGDRVLRIKGLLNVAGVATPVLINGVQHIVHPPVHLERWPDIDHRSRIVFIVQGLSQQRIEASLSAFNALANTDSESEPESNSESVLRSQSASEVALSRP